MNIFYNNKITFRIFIVFLVFIFGENGVAQTGITGITGKVTDKETGEEMIAANIVVTKNGVFVQGETTDIDGNYSIQVDSGRYDMEVLYTGYPTQKITGIVANEGVATIVDVLLSAGSMIEYIDVLVCSGCCRIPLIRHDRTTSGITLSRREYKDFFKNLPNRDINELILMSPGVILRQ